jgi:hypothetical protein
MCVDLVEAIAIESPCFACGGRFRMTRSRNDFAADLAIVAVARLGENLCRLHRLVRQVENILRINELRSLTKKR